MPPIDAELKAYLDANQAEIMAEYEKLWEQQQQSVEEQRAQMTGSLYTQIGFREAGNEADTALMFLQEWGANNNRRAELTARDGIPPPPDDPNGTSMDSGIIFADNGDDKNWDLFGDILNPDKPEGS